jgi:tetratricopeptide (TPR) repeat protein
MSCARALALRLDSAEALTNRGAALHDLGRFEQALEAYEAALTRRLGFLNALTNRGMTFFALNRFGEALASYDAALAVQPNYPDALARRAAVLHELFPVRGGAGELRPRSRPTPRRSRDPLQQSKFSRRPSSLGGGAGELRSCARFASGLSRGARQPRLGAVRTKAVRAGAGELRTCADGAPDRFEALDNSGIALHELKRYSDALSRSTACGRPAPAIPMRSIIAAILSSR